MDYTIQINFDKFVGAEPMEYTNPDGVKQKGIFIPFKPNNVYVNRQHCSVYLHAREANANSYNSSHYIRPMLTKKQREKWKKEHPEEHTPYIGYLVPNSLKKKTRVVKEDNIDEILNLENK